jgi:hypothetical protein
MDRVTRFFFDQSFRIAFLERRGDAFQELFSSIMEKRYPRGDFQRVRPWGKEGDRKNDGYLRSRRTLFQCYAPDELRASTCVAKMDEDFTGALPHWTQHFDTWVFVHNASTGVGPGVAKKLLELEATRPPFKVEAWAFDELRKIARELSAEDLTDVLGPVPSQRDVLGLRMVELIPVLDHMARLRPSAQPDLRPVPPDKIARNLLSDAVAELLRIGMSRADLVKKYFRDRPADEDRIASGFRRKYGELRDAGAAPDDIFSALQRYAGHDGDADPSRQVAVLTVLSHFFQTCDIFERPDPEEAPA